MSETDRDQVLQLHNQMFMSPQLFSHRWGLGSLELAQICSVSQSTTNHWLGGRISRREAGFPYQRILAVADFLLENAAQVQPLLEQWHSNGQQT
ncbi:hypothetical protein [Lyngbya aestuarii]|uniref:hypothetical protein n=1 Tax=Lyngbya aestuarii TaxID=118322 RepID=UPI00403DA43D